MDLKNEFPEFNRNLYPQVEPYSTGFLKVSPIFTQSTGNSLGIQMGIPLFFSMGDQAVVHHQRGAGKSTPHACLVENTTWDLVKDIEKLREHLEIPEWQVFSGSWGSTLALAYSQSHPDKVTGIVLRGIFMLRKKDIDWFYEGGAAAVYPDAWEQFRDLIPENERGCFVDAYHKRLNSDDLETQYVAARAWTKWEMMTAHLHPNEENIKRGDDDAFSLAFARIENHYFVNKGFFPSDSYLLDNIEKIRHISTTIVQINTWGYSTINFFAPMSRYASAGGGPVGASKEFKQMVKALHKAGIEVILDVVYNHTNEVDDAHPFTTSFRGIDNKVYYTVDENNNGQLLNFSGCGNKLNCNHPVVMELILDSLRHWLRSMG